MTRDTHQQFWYTGVVFTKLDHYFKVTVSVNPYCLDAWPGIHVVIHELNSLEFIT